LHSGPVDFHGQDLAAGFSDSGLDALAAVGVDQEDDTSTAACTADFSS
jgi:hypothetical protein